MSTSASIRALAAIVALVPLVPVAAGCDGAAPAPVADAGPERRWTLDSFCPQFAEQWCRALEHCCVESKFDFDPAGCQARFVAETCEPTVELVRRRRVDFTLDAFSDSGADALVDECIQSWKGYFDRCEPSIYEGFDLLARQNEICTMFRGTLPEGGACDVSAECQEPFSNTEWVWCENGAGRPDVGTCRVDALHTDKHMASPCLHHDVCAEGLYCNALPNAAGHCVPITRIGDACTPDPDNDECGFTAFCDLQDAICKTATKGAGASCTASPGLEADSILDGAPVHECRSQVCAFGRCAHPLFWFEPPFPNEVHLDVHVCTGREL